MIFKSRIPEEWAIVSGAYGEVGKTAVKRAFYEIQKYVDYNVDILTDAEYKASNNSGNALVLQIDSNKITHVEGFSIHITQPDENGFQKIEITAHDESGLLYAIDDLEHFYISRVRFKGRITDQYFKVFGEAMPEFSRNSYPKIDMRGFWTWGYVIYDYRAYIDYMSRWKMNTLIIWHEMLPVNIEEVIQYAHANGIKVILGYSCGYGVQFDPNDSCETDKWHDDVIKSYREEYASLDIDGVYFQAFTETNALEIGGVWIAKLTADWINYIAGDMLKEYPNLQIYFGVHATSIRDNYAMLEPVDERIHIVWEDCGSYPYDYVPDNLDGFENTVDYTHKLASLRGKNERFGAVFKGFTVLNWKTFKHHARVAIGEADEDYIRKIYPDRRFKWKHFNASCMAKTKELSKTLCAVADADAKSKLVTFLTEDGLIERIQPQCCAFAAEMMWDPHADIDEIIRVTAETDDTELI